MPYSPNRVLFEKIWCYCSIFTILLYLIVFILMFYAAKNDIWNDLTIYT